LRLWPLRTPSTPRHCSMKARACACLACGHPPTERQVSASARLIEASALSIAPSSPNTRCAHTAPRRSNALSMHGRSSNRRSGVEVLERNGEVPCVCGLHSVCSCHLKDQSGTDQAPGVVKHVTKRILEVWVERPWQQQSTAKRISEWHCVQGFHQFCCRQFSPRHH
jgi:hypothetical protein